MSEDKMEAFYASIEAETNVVSTRTRPSEETQGAFRILRELVRKKFSLMVHPGRSMWMKHVLKHLIDLPPDEGVSFRTKSVMQQLLTTFHEWSKDYDSATIQLESASAGLSRAEKVKEGLEANVKAFWETVTKEKSMCTKLASLEEKKRELEEQINAIKAEIETVTERKNLLFLNGRLLKAARDDLRNQVPRLKVEQNRAKVTQASIEAEWAKLGEQVIGGTCFVEKWIKEP